MKQIRLEWKQLFCLVGCVGILFASLSGFGQYSPRRNAPKNVIIMISDGCGLPGSTGLDRR